MEGLLDSSREFIPLLYHSSSQSSHQTESLTSAQAGREKGAEITSIHPKLSVERPGSRNLGGKGITGFNGSLFSGLPKAAKLQDQLKEQFYKRDFSKEPFHAQTHKAGVNTNSLCSFHLHGEIPQTGRGETPELQILGYLLYKRISMPAKHSGNFPLNLRGGNGVISENPGLEDTTRTPIYRRILFLAHAECQQGQGSFPRCHSSK